MYWSKMWKCSQRSSSEPEHNWPGFASVCALREISLWLLEWLDEWVYAKSQGLCLNTKETEKRDESAAKDGSNDDWLVPEKKAQDVLQVGGIFYKTEDMLPTVEWRKISRHNVWSKSHYAVARSGWRKCVQYLWLFICLLFIQAQNTPTTSQC